MELMWIPVEKTWRLNEKHYGILQGLDKVEMVEKYGAEQVQLWRQLRRKTSGIRRGDPKHPLNDPRYDDVTDELGHPGTEALIDTVARIVPYWESNIKAKLIEHKEVLVAAHGNSLRGIIKHIKNISDTDIIALNIPTQEFLMF